jgi:hypothetical protein
MNVDVIEAGDARQKADAGQHHERGDEPRRPQRGHLLAQQDVRRAGMWVGRRDSRASFRGGQVATS